MTQLAALVTSLSYGAAGLLALAWLTGWRWLLGWYALAMLCVAALCQVLRNVGATITWDARCDRP